MRASGCSYVDEICWWKKYVGEDKNWNVYWWSVLVKTFVYVGEITNIQFHTYPPTYFFTNMHFSPKSLANIRTAVY